MALDNVGDMETFASRKRRQDEVVVDASEQTLLLAYLSQSRNRAVLVTSRSRDTAARLAEGYNKARETLEMNEREGLELLLKKLDITPVEESAVELLRALDCVLLAVSQAAAYINRRTRMTVFGYLSEFEYERNNQRRDILLNLDVGELCRDDSASDSVVTTWQMSFERIRRNRQSAPKLLSLTNVFNLQGIPELTLRNYSGGRAEAHVEEEEDADAAFGEDMDTLRAYSLLSATAEKNLCEIHALYRLRQLHKSRKFRNPAIPHGFEVVASWKAAIATGAKV